MGDIVQFIPKRELDASGNVAAFINLCRTELTVFGEDLEWDKYDWDVSKYIDIRGTRSRIAIVFSTYDTAGNRITFTPMASEFMHFAKAYMRYQHALRPTKDLPKRMTALRALEKTLAERSADRIPRIELANAETFNAAAALIKKDMPASAYWIGSQLQIIAKFLLDNRLTVAQFQWRNPNKKPADTNIRVGAEAEKRRSQKLPSAETIDALIEAYRSAVEQEDVIVTSIAALLVCAPDRINEVFRLPVLCEHRGKYNGEDAYGLRWWPSKGADPMIKWVTKTMEDIAHEAIGRLKVHTKKARNIARWYEKNPGQLYLPDGCEHLRGKELLTPDEIKEILGLANKVTATSWARTHGVPPAKSMRLCGHNRATYLYRFKDVESTIVAMLPKNFPYYDKESGLKYSDALILVPKNLFHQERATYLCMFDIVTNACFNTGLGAGVKDGKSSVFTRLGIEDSAGNPFKITSHQFRHWLNTIAQNAGLSELHIAKWSGRRDIRQNANYDHLTGAELVAKARELSGGKLFGPIADFVVRAPMSKEEFLKLAFPTAHVTEYGYCIHDWTTTPCLKHRDCLLCTDHLCVKGSIGTEALRTKLVQTEELYRRAKAAVENGDFGADRWAEHHLSILKVLRGHKEILDDPEIPDDSVYQLTGIREYSPVSLAVQDRMALEDPDAAALRLVMEHLSSLGHQLPQPMEALPHAEE